MLSGIPTDRTVLKPDREEMVSSQLVDFRRPLLRRFNDTVRSGREGLAAPIAVPTDTPDRRVIELPAFDRYAASSALLHCPRPQVPPGARLILTFEQDTLSSKGGKTEIRDASGNGHVAVLGAGQIVPGTIGNALRLDDGDDIKIPGTFPSGAGPRSLAAWVRADPKGFRRRFQCVAFYGFARVEGVFGIATAKGKWCFFAWGTGYDLPTRVSVDEQWHHHAVTYDGKNILYYYDAQLVLNTLPRSKRSLNTAAGPAALGAPKVTFAGCVDEFAIFGRVLEPEEIRTLFEMGERSQPLQP